MSGYQISDPGERLATSMQILKQEVDDLKRSQSKLIVMTAALRTLVEDVQRTKIPDQLLRRNSDDTTGRPIADSDNQS